jgi:hypothetical protein
MKILCGIRDKTHTKAKGNPEMGFYSLRDMICERMP